MSGASFLRCAVAVLVAFACSTPSRPAPPTLLALMARADSLHLAGEFDSARTLWSEALEAGRQAGLRDVEGRALTGLGLAGYRTGEYTAARRDLGAALSVQREARLDSQLARTYNALGLVAYQQGRLVESAVFYDSSLAAARTRNDEPGIARALGNLGLVRFELGEFDEARKGFAAMRDAGARLGDARMQGNALNNLGMLEVRLGDARAALQPLAEARRLYRTIEYRTGEQNNLGQLATVHAAMGELGQAFAVLDSALTLCRELGLRQEEASNLEVLASLHQGVGDHQRALELYTEAQRINVELEMAVERGTNARNRALLLRELGRADAAAALAAEALRTHDAAGARHESLHDVLLLAELAEARGDAAGGASSLERAERLADSLGAQTALAHVALTRARIGDRSGDARGVLRALEGDPRLWVATGYVGATEALALRARAHARLGTLDSAIAHGREAIRNGQRLRAALGSAELRARAAATFAAAHADLVTALVRSGRVVEAFEAADAERGRALLEHLASRDSAELSAGDAEVIRGERLLREIDELATRRAALEMAEAVDAAAVGRLDARLAVARTAYEALIARTRSAPPAVVGSGAASARAVQDALASDEVLLEYLIAPERLHLFVVSRTAIHHVDQPVGAADLSQRARLAHDLLAGATRARGSPAAEGVLRALHRWLIAPAAHLIPAGARLVIVSHGALGQVPFAALQGADGRWLIEQHAVLQVPSATALRALRVRNAPTGDDRTARVFAPLPESLPGTAREAEIVARQLVSARTYVGAAATERRLRDALAAGSVIHVATHGRLNERNPMFSRIDLYAPPGSAPDDDGRLEVHELFGRRMAGDLVFLSGCETARAPGISPYQGGEEYAALAQVFLHGGVRNVLATAWRIDDAAAALLAERFYVHLAASRPPEALARAQRDLARSDNYRHPRFWAAYQLSGDGQPVPAHTRSLASVQ